jgi:phosphoribosylamine--glycine ligase
METFEAHGIPVPDYREFSNFDQAIAYVKKEDRPFVSKPSGDADKALSYVAKSPADLVYMLERWKKSSKLKPPFILQEKIDGIEMAVGGWLGPHGFNKGWLENFEFKKLCNGDLGCATGEQGTVLRYVAKSKLAKQVLAPFADTLVDAGYTGYVDVNCIIDESGQPWPLEFTMRRWGRRRQREDERGCGRSCDVDTGLSLQPHHAQGSHRNPGLRHRR